MFLKNEKTQILRFRYIFNALAAMFLSVVKGCLCQLPQAVTPTSNIALLILCSRQAIVPLCRPGGVRAARFNKHPQKKIAHTTARQVIKYTKQSFSFSARPVIAGRTPNNKSLVI